MTKSKSKHLKSLKVFAVADIHDWYTWLWEYKEQKVVQEDIDLVLIAGDIQDDNTLHTTFETQKLLFGLDSEDLNKPGAKDFILRLYDQAAIRSLETLICEILPHKFPNAEIVMIPGNHDSWTLKDLSFLKKKDNLKKLHIVDELSVLKLKIKNIPVNILCFPYTTYDAFFKGAGKPGIPFRNRLKSEKDILTELLNLKEFRENETIDILLSHVPPYSILDKVEKTNSLIGSTLLLNITNSLIPSIRYHVFGHNHISPNTFISRINSEGTYQLFYNVSCRNTPNFSTDADRVGVNFEYFSRPSKLDQKVFFLKWKFIKSILASTTNQITTILLRDLKKNTNICVSCKNKYKLPIFGCPFCRDCLNKISNLLTPYNLNNQDNEQLQAFESWYQSTQQIQK